MKAKRRLLAVAAVGGLFTAMNPASSQTWTQTSAPSNFWISVASSSDGSKLAAAAAGDGIYTSTNSGNSWVQSSAPTTNWQAVAASADGGRLVAVVNGGGIYTSPDAGATWTPANVSNANWYAVASSGDGATLIAAVGAAPVPFGGGGQGPVFLSSDSGVSWIDTGLPNLSWTSVSCSADGIKLLAVPFSGGGGRGPFISLDAGAHWAPVAPPGNYLSSAALAGNGIRLLAVDWDFVHACVFCHPCCGAVIYSSTDYGGTWSPSFGLGPAPIYLAASTDGSQWVAASPQAGPITISPDAEATWIPTGSPSTNWSAVASSADGNKFVAVVNGGGIYTLHLGAPEIHFQPANQTTVVAGTNLTLNVGALGAVPLTYQWRFNGAGLPDATSVTLTLTNAHLSDSGTYRVQVSNRFGGVWSSNAQVTVLPALITTQPATGISTNGAVLNAQVTPGSSDTLVWFEWGSGVTYDQRTPATNATAGFSPVFASSPVAGLAQGVVYHFRAVASNILGTVISAEASFTSAFVQTGAPISSWQAVASSADGSRLVAVVNGGPIYLSPDSGVTWSQSSAPAQNWQAVAASADAIRLAAAASSGGIHTSTNSGLTWKATSAPTNYWASLASSADGTMLAAGAVTWWPGDGLIYLSTNAGSTWLPTGAPRANWWAVAAAADGDKLVAVAEGVGIYISTNAGAAWTKTSAPDAYWVSAASSADGRKLAAGVLYGPIHVSTDSGANWTATSAEGWVVASSADGAKLVAGGGPIFISTDSGATWATSGPSVSSWRAVASSADGNKLVGVANGGDIYTWRTTSAPVLDLKPSGGNAVVSWIVPSLDFALQENSDLIMTNWTDVPTTPTLNLISLRKEVILSSTNGNRFFRLKH